MHGGARRDRFFRMEDLKGKKIGISKSLNTIKCEWWRIQEPHGHREHAAAERHDVGRRRARRVPVSGRLVRQARDAHPAEQPVRGVDEARPQARPGVPSAGDGAAERHRRCDLHPEQGVAASAGGDGQGQDDRGPVHVSGLVDPGGQHPGRHHVHRRDGRRAPGTRHRLHEGDDQGRALVERQRTRGRLHPQPADLLPRCRGHLQGHQGRGHGAEPERSELAVRQDRQGLHGQPRLRQERLRCGRLGSPGVPGAGGGRGAQGGVAATELEQASRAAASKSKARGSGSGAPPARDKGETP